MTTTLRLPDGSEAEPATPEENRRHHLNEIDALLRGDWEPNAVLAPALRALADDADRRLISLIRGEGAILDV